MSNKSIVFVIKVNYFANKISLSGVSGYEGIIGNYKAHQKVKKASGLKLLYQTIIYKTKTYPITLLIRKISNYSGIKQFILPLAQAGYNIEKISGYN